MAAQSIVTLMVEREEEMVKPLGGKPKSAKAHFLLPSLGAHDPTPTAMIPPTDPPRIDPHLELCFHGWRNPTNRWVKWVSQMRPLYQPLWERAGIADAIGSSVCSIVQHKDVILELSDRWCSETNSFLFPWGEATITLEDVAMIGGYSLGDECVLKPVDTQDLKEIENKLIMARLEIQRTKAARACQMHWMSKFMGKKSELEHEAFLCYWLSRFVFPGPGKDTIRKNVLPIAIHLSRGTKIALAPAVLASIYKDLLFLNRREEHSIIRNPSTSKPLQNRITLWAPFQLVQVWIWERFPCFSPLNLPTMSIQVSEPRLCRWKKAKVEDIENLSRVLDRSGNTFVWRPYVDTHLGFMSELYGKKHIRMFSTFLRKEALENFVRCIRISELVGVDVDCIEQYMPHRVGMQFGFSQDIPVSKIERQNRTPEIAWKNYMRPILDDDIYVPPRYFDQHYVSTRYYTCWKRSFMIRFEDNSTNERGGMVQPPVVNKKRTLAGHLKSQETTKTNQMIIQTPLSLPPIPSPTPHGCFLAPPCPHILSLSSTPSRSQGIFHTPTLSASYNGCLLARPPHPFTLSLAPTSSHEGLIAPLHSPSLTHILSNTYDFSSPQFFAPVLHRYPAPAPPDPTLTLAPGPSSGPALAPKPDATLMVIRDSFPSPPGFHCR